MWITQTYLTSPEPNAKLHVYYMFRDYVDEDIETTKNIQTSLGRMGDRFGSAVALMMPSGNSADLIENEVREVLPLWNAVHNVLPGILIADTPMSSFEFERGEHYFISFKEPISPDDSAEKLARISKILSEQLDFKFRERTLDPARPSRLDVAIDAVEMKPGIAGFRIDLKKLRHIF